MLWNAGTSSSHVDVQDTVKNRLPKERTNNGPLPAAMGGKKQQPNPPKPIGHWDPNKIQLGYTNPNLPTNVLAIFWWFSAKEICHESIVHELGREEESVSGPASPLAHFLRSAATWILFHAAAGSHWASHKCTDWRWDLNDLFCPQQGRVSHSGSDTPLSGIPAVVIFLLVSAHANTPLLTHSQATEPWQTAETPPASTHHTQQAEAPLCLVKATQMPPIFHFTGMSLGPQEGAETSEGCPHRWPRQASPRLSCLPPLPSAICHFWVLRKGSDETSRSWKDFLQQASSEKGKSTFSSTSGLPLCAEEQACSGSWHRAPPSSGFAICGRGQEQKGKRLQAGCALDASLVLNWVLTTGARL